MSWHTYKILAWNKEIEQIKRGEWPIPLYSVLQLNFSCNQNCLSCAHAENNKNHFTPSREDAFKIVDRLFDYGIRNFEWSGGGEPTILPYFGDLYSHIVERGGNNALITNGVNLSDDLINLIANTAIFCRVSLETGDKDLYCRYKRVPEWHFDKAVDNIHKLIAARRGDTEVSLKFDIDKNLWSERHIKASFDLACSLGVDLAGFKSMTGETELNDLEKLEAEMELNELIKDNTSKVTFINSFRYKKDVPQCWLSPLHCVVDGRGNVYMCCYYYRPDAHKQEGHAVGNILRTPFRDLWETEEHREKIRNIKPENCAKFDCKYFAMHKIVDEALKPGRLEIL